MERFPISERQTNAILDLRLYQLTGMEREKIEEEYAELMKLIEGFREILGNESRLLEVIKDELLEMKAAYPSTRRCVITEAEGDLRMEDLIPNDGCVITITKKGFIKRTSVEEYRSQHRGGKGVIGMQTKEEDFVEHLFSACTHDYILFFTSKGRMHCLKVGVSLGNRPLRAILGHLQDEGRVCLRLGALYARSLLRILQRWQRPTVRGLP